MALLDILLLWLVLLLTIFEFKKHSLAASLILVPYFFWVTYAVTLNMAILAYN